MGSLMSSVESAAGTAGTIGSMESMMAQQSAIAGENMKATLQSGQLSAEQATTKALANVMTSGANAVSQAAGQAH